MNKTKVLKGSSLLALTAGMVTSGAFLALPAQAVTTGTSSVDGDRIRVATYTQNYVNPYFDANTPATAYNDGGRGTAVTWEVENVGTTPTTTFIRTDATGLGAVPAVINAPYDCSYTGGTSTGIRFTEAGNPVNGVSYFSASNTGTEPLAVTLDPGTILTCSQYLGAIPTGQQQLVRVTATQAADRTSPLNNPAVLPGGYVVTDNFYANGSTAPNPELDTTAPVITVGYGPINGEVGTPIAPVTITTDDPNAVIAINAASLPAGLTYDAATRRISGTPTATGVGTITGTATDAYGRATQINVAYAITDTTGPTFTSPPVTTVDQGAAVNSPVTTDDPAATISLDRCVDASNGQIANYFTYANGAITGATTNPGTYNCYLTARDAAGNTNNRVVSIVVNDTAAPVITPITDKNATVNQEITPIVVAVRDDSPTQVDITGLADGLAYNPVMGRIEGAPTVAGPATVTVTATDSAGNTSTEQFVITVAGPADTVAPVINAPAGIAGTVGTPIAPVTITTDDPAATIAVTGLPAGLTYDAATGVISGTPTTTGNATVTVTATDSAGNTTTRTIPVAIAAADSVAPVFTSPSTVDAVINEPVQAPVATDDANATITLEKCVDETGASVSYFTFNATAKALVGTADKAGTYTCTLKATDAAGNVSSKDVKIVVGAPDTTAPAFTSSNTIDGEVNKPIAGDVTTDDANATITLDRCVDQSGALVSYFTYDATAKALVGTADKAGTYTCTLKATDAAGNTSTQDVTVAVAAATDGVEDDSYTIANNNAEGVTLDVETNDTLEDGTLTLLDANGKAVGTLTLEGGVVSIKDGKLVFDPTDNWTGKLNFAYGRMVDGKLAGQATVNLTVEKGTDPGPADTDTTTTIPDTSNTTGTTDNGPVSRYSDRTPTIRKSTNPYKSGTLTTYSNNSTPQQNQATQTRTVDSGEAEGTRNLGLAGLGAGVLGLGALCVFLARRKKVLS